MAIILPPGASADRDLARRVAEDTNSLQAAASYWKKRFEEFGEHVVETAEITSDGLTFSLALEDGELESLAPETKGLISATEANEVFKRSGCLMSAAEVAQHVDPALDASKVADALQALTAATIPLEDPGLPSVVTTDQAITALLLAREFFDVLRRFTFCHEHAKSYGLTTAELLALYRREGAYAIAPPLSSYRRSPVISTTDSGCRTHAVSLFDATTTRGGFIISHDESAPRLPTRNTPESRAYGILFRNLVTLGGIDTVVSPRLPAEDELIFFLDSATRATPMPAPLDTICKNIRGQLSRQTTVGPTLFARQLMRRSQVERFDSGCLGLMMLRLDELGPSDPAPDATTLLAGLEADYEALLASHTAKRETGGRIFIEADDTGTDTKLCLGIQTSWYESRKHLHTLLARRDRQAAAALPDLSPFLTYLRFHIGDPAFVGVLIRALRQLDAIKKEAKRQPWKNSPGFVVEAERVAWAAADEKKAKDWLARWAPVGSEFAWRHLGLAEQIANAGVRPTWLKNPPAPSQLMARTAAVAADVVGTISERKLLPALDVLLRRSPISVIAEKFGLIGFPDVAARRIALAKVHNFEQLRLVYEAAAAKVASAPAAAVEGGS